MNIQKKLVISMALAVFGLALIVGGTGAYFNDVDATNSTIKTGSVDLEINKETLFQIEDMVPGDITESSFELTNNGSVEMKEMRLHSSYEVVDNGEPNSGDDLGEHIHVNLFHHAENEEQKLVFETTLSELTDNPQQIGDVLTAEGEAEAFTVQFTFVDNKENQNHFQTDELKLTWELEGIQGN